MSPTVFRYRGYRFFFFSRDQPRVHVHVHCAAGEAKFWVVPRVSLAANHGLSNKQVAELMKLVEERKDEIQDAWKEHFQG
jgi:hypothetical protein